MIVWLSMLTQAISCLNWVDILIGRYCIRQILVKKKIIEFEKRLRAEYETVNSCFNGLK